MKRSSLTVASACLVACATAPTELTDPIKPAIEDDPRFGAAADTVCFSGGLSGFFEVGNRAVVLRRSVDESYLVRTGYCRSLRHVEGLRLPDGPDTCLTRGDVLKVYEQPFPLQGVRTDQPERCTVMAIHQWQNLKLDAPFYEEP